MNTSLRLCSALFGLLVLVVAQRTPLLAQPEAILTITPGGHTGRINDLAVTRDRRYIITTGDDKTIQVWDIENQQQAEVIVGQIGVGLEGQLYALALSPDNRWLAVAGYLEGHVIRLYDWPTRRLVGLLQGHTNVVNALAFTPDSKRLLSASADRSIRLWEVQSRQALQAFTGHRGSVVDIAAAGERFVSASNDGSVKLWNLNNDAPLATASLHRGAPATVAISAEAGTIASGGTDGQIVIYTGDLSEKQTLANGVAPAALAFSPSGSKLLTGSAAKGQDRCHVWERILDGPLRQSGGPEGGYAGHDNSVLAVAWLDERQAVTAGGNDGRVAVWTLAFGGSIGSEPEEEVVFSSRGRPVLNIAAAPDGRRLAYATEPDSLLVKPIPRETIDLISGQVDELPPAKALQFTQASLRNRELSLSIESAGPQERQDALLVLRRGSQRVASIARTSSDGYRHRAVSWVGQRFVSGGNSGILTAYDADGNALAQLKGHQADILALAPTADGRRVWSASADQTMVLWNLDDISNASAEVPSLNETFTSQGWQRFFARPEYAELARQKSRKAWTDVIARMRSTRDRNANVIEARLRKFTVTIQPLLQLFVGRDGEWVLWHPSGYYSASADGEKYIAWHVNHGPNTRADRYPVAYLRERYYKPELIERILTTGSLAAALSGTDWLDTEPDKGPVLAPAPAGMLATLNWISPTAQASTSSTASIDIELDVQSPTPVLQVNVIVNGRPAAQARGLTPVPSASSASRIRRTVSLDPGENRITVEVTNSAGRSSSEPHTVTYRATSTTASDDRFKPTLYTLHIGVTRYQDPTLNLTYARKDAESLHAAWQGQSGGLFKEVKATLLTDATATRKTILRAVADISKQATQRDLVLVSFAGHGVNDLQNRFYLLPYETETNDLVSTAIRYSELTDLLADLPGKVVVMLDACHSGNFARQGLATRNVQVVDEFVRELTSSEVGVVVMAASTGRQPSVESAAWGHGAFTKAVLDALSGKGDYNGDRVIHLKELDLAVTEGVKNLTKGEQKPVTYTPANLPSFPLFLLKVK